MTRMWGDQPYFGLDASFDPDWLLTEAQKELRAELIELCRTTLRPNAVEADKKNFYPRANVDALASLRLLGLIVPKQFGGRGENTVGAVMVAETIARYGCPSTALIYMMHTVAVAGLCYRAKGNAAIENLLSRLDDEALIGTASYTDPETGGHFWYPKMSGAKRTEAGWHVQKKAAWTTSSGYADWYISQTTSPDFAGDYSDLSVFLFMKDEVNGAPGKWEAMGMHGNQSGPVEIDTVVPFDRIVGWPGDGAASNDEAIDPLAMLMYAGSYNGLGLACIDVAKSHVTRKAHVQYARRVADYPTIQDSFGRAVMEGQASRLYAYALAKALDDATENGSWEIYYKDPKAMPRAKFAVWAFQAKFLSTRFSYEVSDKMLATCGGRGYMADLGLERLVRDSKAGWIMGPSNEITAQLIGKWALLGPDAVDWWNQRVDEPVMMNEIGKLDAEGKRRLIEKLQAGLMPQAAE
ncbi:acyl-CoA dehydrogenase family protein [Pseudogemmobacter humi]|uniref:Acryloyl-CoA reductase (NADH) n=1 Tax=Pseudogemmobacter humi TaxID=2483812 RepID=A0A3P5XGK7_9RHOB|nr:acyl-CoA dehydrogenase family protein [Pseudogemmobacter humi]VDC33927.1 Acryloyl-CoA reductase (NADH) [Pseudogemmobacter humi]